MTEKPYTPQSPKYPEINVTLVGEDGNAFSIMGKVKRALRSNNVPSREIEEYLDESMSGDHDHLLQTAMCWVMVD